MMPVAPTNDWYARRFGVAAAREIKTTPVNRPVIRSSAWYETVIGQLAVPHRSVAVQRRTGNRKTLVRRIGPRDAIPARRAEP